MEEASAALALPAAPAEHSEAQVREARARGEVELLHLVATDGQRPQPDVGQSVTTAHVELAQARRVPCNAPQPHVCHLPKQNKRRPIEIPVWATALAGKTGPKIGFGTERRDVDKTRPLSRSPRLRSLYLNAVSQAEPDHVGSQLAHLLNNGVRDGPPGLCLVHVKVLCCS